MGIILPVYFTAREEFEFKSLQNAAGSLMLYVSIVFCHREQLLFKFFANFQIIGK